MKTGYLIDEALEHVLAALMPANRLVCKVMLHTGLRVGDVVSLPKSKVKQNFTIREQKLESRGAAVCLRRCARKFWNKLVKAFGRFRRRETRRGIGRVRRFGKISSERSELLGCL